MTSNSVEVLTGQLDGILHVLERRGDDLFTACSEDALSPYEVPVYAAPNGDVWKPHEHPKPCRGCFDSLDAAPETTDQGAREAASPTLSAGNEPSPELQCDLCPYEAKSPAGLSIHRGRKHGPRGRPESDAGEHACSECGRTFATVQALNGHLGGHARQAAAEELDDQDVDEVLDDAPAGEAGLVPEFWRLCITLPNDEAWSRDGIWEELRQALDDAGFHTWTIGEPVAMQLVPMQEDRA